ncbi:T9SS type A sorting domain-containing protein, partial [Lishizhenia sp.]|uniref:T9SS type A sorting domain-containing protein n=1 Tax=Lishizhenia sp. TaxID=2497594 RepID=UPI00299E1ED7
SFQSLNTGSRLVEMDTLGVKQRAVEMDNVTDPRQVCFFQDSIFLLAGPTHNLLLMTMNRSDLSLKILQYWLSNNTWLWSEENYRMVNYLDSSLLMTYGMGFTLELNNEMQIVAEHIDFGAATGLLVMKDTTIRYVQRGPYYGIKSNEVLEPQLAVVKHDTLFTSDVLTNCYSDDQPYAVSDALFYSTPSSFSNNSFSLSTTTGQFMVSNREMNLDDHCVYYLSAVDEETLNASVSLYPNPVSNSLQYSTDYKILELRILNALGQEQRSEIGVYQTINVEALQTGVYFLQLKLETGDWVTKRFVKE